MFIKSKIQKKGLGFPFHQFIIKSLPSCKYVNSLGRSYLNLSLLTPILHFVLTSWYRILYLTSLHNTTVKHCYTRIWHILMLNSWNQLYVFVQMKTDSALEFYRGLGMYVIVFRENGWLLKTWLFFCIVALLVLFIILCLKDTNMDKIYFTFFSL